MKRLDQHLNRAYLYAEKHFGGQNIYLEEMKRNVKYAEVAAIASDSKLNLLRRKPPTTLLPSVRAYPDDLVIR
jgi:pyruvate carboxylase